MYDKKQNKIPFVKKKKSGKSTRIIDNCIQRLFNTGKAFIYDESRNIELTKVIHSKFKNRMRNEHSDIDYASVFTEDCGIFCFKIVLL